MGKNCAIILAAGKGARMEASINKQFLCIKDKPILFYTLNTFEKNSAVDEIILVAAKDEIGYCKKEIIEKYGFAKVSQIIEGGKERQDSVYRGLMEAEGSDIVIIHDGARPFVEKKVIEDGIKYAKLYGACSCGVNPKDTIKIKDADGFSLETPDRGKLFNVQTPQCFQYDLILECHKRLLNDQIKVTDDTMVVERYGGKVYLYEGSYSNIKITTPDDLLLGEKILDNLAM